MDLSRLFCALVHYFLGLLHGVEMYIYIYIYFLECLILGCKLVCRYSLATAWPRVQNISENRTGSFRCSVLGTEHDRSVSDGVGCAKWCLWVQLLYRIFCKVLDAPIQDIMWKRIVCIDCPDLGSGPNRAADQTLLCIQSTRHFPAFSSGNRT